MKRTRVGGQGAKSFEEEARSALELPLSWPFYDELAIERGVPEQELAGFKKAFSQEYFSFMVRALEWAAKTPEHDFASILPNVEYANSQLHAYFTLLYEQLSEKHREWYGEWAV